ncbi:MAG: response regulator transcription factor [Bacteroidota bacterium]|jgi:DNA-binding NarL/FixJ family response regulator|nr:MAG: DNA-binding response regulator [Bacteroidota bacterium]
MKITVLIVDDHTILREGMASLLSGSEDIEVVGMASSGEEAVNLVSDLNPAVVLMDIVMAGMNGLEATRWIKEQNSDVKVIIISSEVTREYVTQGIKCGIDGYLPKDANREEVVQAIRTVAGGAKFFDDAITRLIFEDYYSREKDGRRRPTKSVTPGLTRREYEIIEQVASGKSNQEVADALFVSVKTVETHKKNILDKLGLKNSLQLVRYAIKNNIISLDEE